MARNKRDVTFLLHPAPRRKRHRRALGTKRHGKKAADFFTRRSDMAKIRAFPLSMSFRHAVQGPFEVEDVDESSPDRKSVRVVTTVDLYLE